MIRWCLAAAAALAAPSCATAATLALWQGEATITAATSACASTTSERQTIGVGTTLRILYRPNGLAANGADTRLAFNHDSQAHFAILIAGTPGAASGTYTAFGAKYDGRLVANQGGTYNRFVQIPATIAATTPFVEYQGQIVDFMFVAGCTVSFRAALSTRP